jgi:hypothetical protein
MERCVSGPKNKTFGAHFSKDIILCENDEIINIQPNVPETFNNFFTNVAKDIGSKDVNIDNNHPSIKTIINNKTENREFVEKQINKICIKKATGKDGISSKILKLSKPAVSKHISNLVNKSIESSVFRDKIKEAQVVLLHTKK